MFFYLIQAPGKNAVTRSPPIRRLVASTDETAAAIGDHFRRMAPVTAGPWRGPGSGTPQAVVSGHGRQ
jgi:hypothetical protein